MVCSSSARSRVQYADCARGRQTRRRAALYAPRLHVTRAPQSPLPRADPRRMGKPARKYRATDQLSVSGELRADFYLTQLVSHHHLDIVDAFQEATEAAGIHKPAVWGVFYYRSANERTLSGLASFFPVPFEGILSDFRSGMSAAGDHGQIDPGATSARRRQSLRRTSTRTVPTASSRTS